MLFLTMLLGCEVAPRFVHEASEVDAYLVRGAIASACVALDNRQDDSLRTYTTQELVKLTTNPTASRCLCAAVYRPEEHRMDPAVMKGLVRSQRDDLALCAAKALEDAEVPDRPAVATAIGNLDAPKGYEALGAIAAADGPMDLRLAATRALRLGTGTKSTLMGILDHEDPALRTAAAEALTGRRDDEIATRAKRLLDEDPSVEVRAAALGMLVGADERGSQRAVCKV
ncbi:MAG: HEAT repeat domain-containing protein, partial [Myxococcales bacterium]|nr:HEAT repeat domain-containing protein [Myxococcales bacterium]